VTPKEFAMIRGIFFAEFLWHKTVTCDVTILDIEDAS